MRVAVNGIRLYFDAEGAQLVPDGPVMRERPTVLLLHGGPGADHATYKPAMSPLADHAQLLYLDHRGHGRSDRGTPDQWTLAQWADDAAGFLDALDIARCHVLGASFGGFVAQAFATAHPDRVSRLALVATGPRSDAELSAEVFTQRGGAEIGEIARRYLGGDMTYQDDYMRRCLPFYTIGDFDLEALGRSIEHPEPRELFFRPGGEWHTMDFRAALGRITCPTLILHGECDPIVPLPLARELHAAIRPGIAELRVVEGAGHGWIDHPDAWMSALEAFLSED